MKNLIVSMLLLYGTINKIIWLGDIGNIGARYPINDIYDGNANHSFQGQLNSVGMRQQYLLGTYLRSDYIDQEQLIDAVYNPNSIQVFSCAHIDLTYDSAVSKLYGLFPTGTGWRIPKQVPKQRLDPPYQSDFKIRGLQKNDDLPFALTLGYQPLPVWPLDNVLNDPCPNSQQIKNKRLEEIQQNLTIFQIQNSDLIAKARLVFNLSDQQLNIPTMADLYDTLVSDLTLGKKLPIQWNNQDMKRLQYISDYYSMLLNGGSYAQLFSTLLLISVKQKMESVLNTNLSSDYRKWSMFIPKENTLAPIMTQLNLTSPECLKQKWKNETITTLNCMQPPKFSSNLLIEFHQVDDTLQFGIKVRYNGYYASMCEKKQTLCQYKNFWERINLDFENYQRQCYAK